MLIEFSAILGLSVDQHELINRLQNYGVQHLTTCQVMESGINPRTQLRGLASEAIIDQVIEFMFVAGKTSRVTTSIVESHALRERIVAVPIGSGQRVKPCRVTEYLLGDKVLRAEPFPQDLGNATRHEVLSTWKRWRQDS